MEDAAVPPEILGVGEQVPLMLRHGDRNTALDGLVIALALIPMMVCVQNPVHFIDAQLAKVVQDLARPEIDQHACRTVADYVHGARVLEAIQVFGQFLGPARGGK
jgi:hypothetical protein